MESKNLVHIDWFRTALGTLCWLVLPFGYLVYDQTHWLQYTIGAFIGLWIFSAHNLSKARVVACPNCHLHHPSLLWPKNGEFTCADCHSFVKYDGDIVTTADGAQPITIKLDDISKIQWPPGCLACGRQYTQFSDIDLGKNTYLPIPVCDEHTHHDIHVDFTWDTISLKLPSPKVAAQMRLLNHF